MDFESPFKKQKMDIKYLWRNSGCQKTQNIYYYENEKKELIWGNIISDDEYPYSESSIYSDGAVRIGIAHKYIKTLNQSPLDLQDIKKIK